MLSWEEEIEKETVIWNGLEKTKFSLTTKSDVYTYSVTKVFEETLYCLRDTLAGCNWAIWGDKGRN